MTETREEGILEALGYDELEGLKDPKGKDLGKVKVPCLPGFTSLRLQNRVLKQFMKVADVTGTNPDNPPPVTDVLDKIYDEEGIELFADVLCATFAKTEKELETMFHVDSLHKLYAFIVQRDFNVKDLVESFVSRFSEMFGGEAVPPPEKPKAN